MNTRQRKIQTDFEKWEFRRLKRFERSSQGENSNSFKSWEFQTVWRCQTHKGHNQGDPFFNFAAFPSVGRQQGKENRSNWLQREGRRQRLCEVKHWKNLLKNLCASQKKMRISIRWRRCVSAAAARNTLFLGKVPKIFRHYDLVFGKSHLDFKLFASS